MNKLNILFLILVFSFCLTTISASDNCANYGTFKQNDNINLIQTCSDCTYINITSINYPNSTNVVSDIAMQKIGGTYNYTFTNAQPVGIYTVTGRGDDSFADVWCYTFQVTATGSDLNTSKAMSYILIFVFSFIIFIGLLIMGIALPYNNSKDQMTGYILQVNNLKYFKSLCIALSYVVAMFLSYLAWMITYAYLDMEFLTNIMRFIFTILAVLALPLFVLFMWISITNVIKDNKIAEMLSRGFSVRE